jgi:hypothetical protein
MVVKIVPLNQETIRIMAAEMEHMRKTAEYTWTDFKTDTEIARELNITPVLDKMQEYRKIVCNM